MYKNILIPVMLDQSRNTEASLKAAQALADEGAVFTVMHAVVPPPVYVADLIPMDYIEQQRGDMQSELDAVAATLPNCRAALINGSAGRTITQYAEDHGCDCIVIASHTPAMSDILLGSTANFVTRHAAAAVLVVR